MTDYWDFYLLTVENKPASIMVDLGIRNSAPMKTHPYMGYLRIHMKNPRSDGLSSQEEFDPLCDIGDAIQDNIDLSARANLYVGRNTSDGNRDFYFYTSDVEHLNQCLDKVVKSFPEYDFTLGGREDSEWSTYLNFLYPNPFDKQQMMDRRLCEVLKSNGDNLSIEREIDHRVYFPSQSKMKLFEKYLQDHGFIKIKMGKTKPLFGERYIDFTHMGAPEDISKLVSDLFHKAQDLDGDYDGWACSVQNTEPS